LTESLDEERDRDRALGRREEAREEIRGMVDLSMVYFWKGVGGLRKEKVGAGRRKERKEGIEPTRHGSSFGVQNLREGIILVSFVIGGLDID